MTHRRGARLVGGAAAAIITVAAGLGADPATAAGFGANYSVVAAADGMRVTVVMPGGPLSDDVVDIGGPSARAQLDSLGTSKAFASFPYPGDTIANSPGLVRTASGLPLPDPPSYVQSDHPIVPTQETSVGPYLLRAESDDHHSAATAAIGMAADERGAAGLVCSDVAVSATPEAVVSTAQSAVDSFSLGPLRIARVVSRAHLSLFADGTRATEADIAVVGAAVGSTGVTLAPSGVRAGDSEAPLPDPSPIRQALAAAGITVEFMPRHEVPSGVVAPALRITQTQESGSKVIYVLGAASASGDIGGLVDQSGSQADATLPAVPATEPNHLPADPAVDEAGQRNPPAATPPGLAGTGPAPPSGTGHLAVVGAPSAIAHQVALSDQGPDPGPSAAEGTGLSQPAVQFGAGSARAARAAAIAALVGAPIDTRPLYGVLLVGGILALTLAVAMRYLRPVR